MPEYKTLVEFLMAGADPEFSARGYSVYSLTMGNKTAYSIVDTVGEKKEEPEIVASAETLSEAVEVIIKRVCEQIYRISQLPHLSEDMPSGNYVQ